MKVKLNPRGSIVLDVKLTLHPNAHRDILAQLTHTAITGDLVSAALTLNELPRGELALRMRQLMRSGAFSHDSQANPDTPEESAIDFSAFGSWGDDES